MGTIESEKRPTGVRVLLFDDDACVRSVLEQILRWHGHEVVEFGDATNCCVSRRPGEACPCKDGETCADALVTDLKMPRVDGLTFIESLVNAGCKRRHRAIISAFWTSEAMACAKRHGCRVFVKPIGVLEVEQWISNLQPGIDANRLLVNAFRE